MLVTSTDFDWRQAETKRIVKCGKSCPLGKRQIRVDGEWVQQWGRGDSDGRPHTPKEREREYVGILNFQKYN